MTWLRIKVNDCRDCPELGRMRVDEARATFYCPILAINIVENFVVRSGAPFPPIPPKCPRLLTYNSPWVDEIPDDTVESNFDDVYELEIEEEDVPENYKQAD